MTTETEEKKDKRLLSANEKVLYELFVPTFKERPLSKFVTDKYGNRVLRPPTLEPAIMEVAIPNNEEEENG